MNHLPKIRPQSVVLCLCLGTVGCFAEPLMLDEPEADDATDDGGQAEPDDGAADGGPPPTAPQEDCSVVDACGVCDGDGTTCADCDGEPNGTAELDACDVCNGDGSSCADCAGVPNGTAVLDVCGICEGDDSSCLDCAGVPNGDSVEDECGECDGDGSTCADCNGVPNGSGEPDECGVCDGGGGPCWGCTSAAASNFDPLARIDDGSCSCETMAAGTADQANLVLNAGSGASSQWQSFTVGLSGGLTRIDLGVSSPVSDGSSPGTLTFFEGEGVAGLVVGTQAITLEPVFNTMQEFVLDDPIPMTAGDVYTYRLTVPEISVGFVDVHSGNPYAGGRSGWDAGTDLRFQTHVAQCG